MQRQLKNRYFVIRHGESKPNVGQFILSHLEDGKHADFGLTEKGRQQVQESVTEALIMGWLGSDTLIYSSPFSRCKETAQIAKSVLGVRSEVMFEDRLRERWFGALERQHSENYQLVWDFDKESS